MYLRFQSDIKKQMTVFAAVQSDLYPLLALSPVSLGEFQCNKGYSTERSGLEQYLLLYTLHGKGKLSYQDKIFDATPNTVMLIDCNQWQHYRTDGDAWHFRFVHFSGTAARYLYESATAGERFVFPIGNPVTFRAALGELFSLTRVALPHEFLLCSNALGSLFALILEERQLPSPHARTRASILQAKEYIEQQYAAPLSLDSLATQCYLSKYYFLRLFRSQTGFSPSAYIRACRITRAQTLLTTTDLSVEKISEQVGYEDVSAFIRAFRRVTGVTPAKFRIL